MDAQRSIAEQGRTSLLLVDTEDSFLNDILDLIEADKSLKVIAVTHRIEDAFHRAVTLTPDVIMIGWGPAVKPFVEAVETLCAGRAPPRIVIVLAGDITNTPGLGLLSIMPSVSFIVRSQLPRMLPRLASMQTTGALVH